MFGKSLKAKWNRYLEKMAESNKKLYGEQRLDCCGMNHENSSKETHEKFSEIGGTNDGR